MLFVRMLLKVMPESVVLSFFQKFKSILKSRPLFGQTALISIPLSFTLGRFSRNPSSKPPSAGRNLKNIGTGRGYSVLEMINAFSEASGRNIAYEIVDRRLETLPKILRTLIALMQTWVGKLSYVLAKCAQADKNY
jgi:hypothetical protein